MARRPSAREAAKPAERSSILVYADWAWLGNRPLRMGTLYAALARGVEVFSFEYDLAWLKARAAQALDPELGLFRGRQYTRSGSFGARDIAAGIARVVGGWEPVAQKVGLSRDEREQMRSAFAAALRFSGKR